MDTLFLEVYNEGISLKEMNAVRGGAADPLCTCANGATFDCSKDSKCSSDCNCNGTTYYSKCTCNSIVSNSKCKCDSAVSNTNCECNGSAVYDCGCNSNSR